MFFKKLKLPMILLACGLLLAVGAYFCTSIVKEPTITENDFQYSVTYQLNGETKPLRVFTVVNLIRLDRALILWIDITKALTFRMLR